MSTGEGIVWATIILIVSAGIFVFIKRKRGAAIVVAKILGALILLGILIGIGVYAYGKYQALPRPQTGMYGVTLGMSPVNVKLTLGEPVYEGEIDNPDTGKKDSIQLYKEYSWSEMSKYVRFSEKDGEYHAYLICDMELSDSPFEFYSWTTQDEVIEKLGEPSHESIRADGLAKLLTFRKFNVAVEFEKNKVTSFCVTDNETVTFAKEYGKESGIDWE